MAWVDVPAKLAQLDAEEYTDDTNGTTASAKLIFSFTNGKSDDPEMILPEMRDEFEKQLDYRLGAMVNLRKSKALPIEVLKTL